MSQTIRNPQQTRSIDKKHRIIEAGYKLFAEKGYFNTNTAEIAKEAQVSTGIVYGYFHDKKDILIEVIDLYINNIFTPLFIMFDNFNKPINFEKAITNIIDITIQIHLDNYGIHQALYALANTDEYVKNKFLFLEEKITKNLTDNLIKNDYNPVDLKERIHLAMETIQTYAHERVFDNHPYIDYSKMRILIEKMLYTLFEKA